MYYLRVLDTWHESPTVTKVSIRQQCMNDSH